MRERKKPSRRVPPREPNDGPASVVHHDKGVNYIITLTQTKKGFALDVMGDGKENRWRMMFNISDDEAIFVYPISAEPVKRYAISEIDSKEIYTTLYMEGFNDAIKIYIAATENERNLQKLSPTGEQEEILAKLYKAVRKDLGRSA